MGKAQRGDEVDASSRIGKKDAIRRRDMVLASKRRKGRTMNRENESFNKEAGSGAEWTGFSSE